MRVSLRGCLNKMGNFRAFLNITLVFLVFELCLVCCDITDGNTEHLKREHSLTKPYQGKMAQLARQLTWCSVHSFILSCVLEVIERHVQFFWLIIVTAVRIMFNIYELIYNWLLPAAQHTFYITRQGCGTFKVSRVAI